MGDAAVILLQLCGGNASGKSTVMGAVVASDPDLQIDHSFSLVTPLTISPRYQLVVIGTYTEGRTHGMDRVSPKTRILLALDYAIAYAQPRRYSIAWEGIIIQTGQYHVREFLPRGLTPVYVYLDVPLAVAQERILTLRGGRLKTVAGRDKGFRRLAHRLETEHGARVVYLDGQRPVAALAKEVRGILHHERNGTS